MHVNVYEYIHLPMYMHSHTRQHIRMHTYIMYPPTQPRTHVYAFTYTSTHTNAHIHNVPTHPTTHPRMQYAWMGHVAYMNAAHPQHTNDARIAWKYDRSLLQNIVYFTGLFCKRDLLFSASTTRWAHRSQYSLETRFIQSCHTSHIQLD